MKHIQKIVKITCILKEKFGWGNEDITSFITALSNYSFRLRYCNEALIGEQKPYTIICERQYLEDEVFNYLEARLPAFSKWEFSHNVMDCPIKIDLGKECANYEDNKSFVIDL